MKKPVRSSSLAIRFYVSDGWTGQILSSFLNEHENAFGEPWLLVPFIEDDNPYFTYRLGSASRLDFDKLMEHVGQVDRMFNENPNETDREFIERMI